MKTVLALSLTLCTLFSYAQNNAQVDTTKRVVVFKSSWNQPSNLKIVTTAGKANPLYVVDGSVMTVDEFEKIDQFNIESISIVRDTATAIIYGDKGRNGIVLVQMKKKTGF